MQLTGGWFCVLLLYRLCIEDPSFSDNLAVESIGEWLSCRPEPMFTAFNKLSVSDFVIAFAGFFGLGARVRHSAGRACVNMSHTNLGQSKTAALRTVKSLKI